MASVETVQGAVDADDLGLVLVHEHVRFRDEAVAEQWPSRYDEELEFDAALVAVNAAKERGVQTIVDPTAMFGGRDVRFMKRVADETGVRIVACTGIYSYDYLPHYFENRDADVMADHFVEDIERGIQDTGIRAAFLKCAADAAGVTENVEKIHRAVARASVQTGAPIMAHSMPAVATGPRQVEIFEEEGVEHVARADRPLRRHRRHRLHRGPDRHAACTSVSTATAWRCTCRSTGATRPPRSSCAAVTPSG